MDFKEILSFADGVILDKTGKHLNDLQRDILKETLQGQKYSKIAAEHDCTIEYVREVASELWKGLSEALGEKVKKTNVRTTLERAGFSIISPVSYDFSYQENNINFCGNGSNPPKPNPTPNNPYLDLDDAPTLNQFYGRETELETLETLINTQKTCLIAISGLSGMGKTTLTLKLVEKLQNKFNYIIYRNLADFANLDELLEDLITIFGKDEDKPNRAKAQQRTLLKYLRKYSCLLILDHGQVLFKMGELAGTYHPNYQNFSLFFQQLGQINHQSCILLNTWETPKEIQTLADNTPKVQIFHLTGLGNAAKAIFQKKSLKDEDIWEQIIQIYEGHPQWLKWVAGMIKELWEGNIRQCWQYQQIILPDELKTSLNSQIERLSPLEQQIMTYLGQSSHSLTLTQLMPHFNNSPTDTFNAVQSLKKRYLIEKNEYLTLTPVIGEYFRQIGEL